ncbi:MAG: NAD-dependent epimerase/dehydratase family protein [Cycloclasticus sp.]|jgi:Nucleoside-diphosphate-sugar epimerases
MRVLVTGAEGFIGRGLCEALRNSNHYCIAATKTGKNGLPNEISIGVMTSKTDWSDKLSSIDIVIHLAGLAHGKFSYDEYVETNFKATERLASQSSKAGVQQFIFMSTVLAHAEKSEPSNMSPISSAAKTKYQGEVALKSICRDSQLKYTILKLPLVYGPGVKGNFLNLLKLAKTAIPLPFGAIHNSRSMIYLDNLIDLIFTTINNSNARGKILLASDGDDVSLSRLIFLMRQSMRVSQSLIPIPAFLFRIIGFLTGRQDVISNLVDDFRVDNSDAQKYLNWTAPYTVEQGVKVTVDAFLKTLKRAKS